MMDGTIDRGIRRAADECRVVRLPGTDLYRLETAVRCDGGGCDWFGARYPYLAAVRAMGQWRTARAVMIALELSGDVVDQLTFDHILRRAGDLDVRAMGDRHSVLLLVSEFWREDG